MRAPWWPELDLFQSEGEIYLQVWSKDIWFRLGRAFESLDNDGDSILRLRLHFKNSDITSVGTNFVLRSISSMKTGLWILAATTDIVTTRAPSP